MAELELNGSADAALPRRRRSVDERRRIVEETLEAGSSVARVARKHGVNANQVFAWRRLYNNGELNGEGSRAVELLPVSVVAEDLASTVEPSPHGVIHIELPDRALLTLEGFVAPALIQAVLKSLLS